MSTSPINPLPQGGPGRDEDDPDLASPDVSTRPADDSPLTESVDPAPETDEDPDDQLLRDPEA
jgi:hypothetical protein